MFSKTIRARSAPRPGSPRRTPAPWGGRDTGYQPRALRDIKGSACGWLIAWLVCVPGAVSAQGRAPELPPGEGRELAQSVCGTACHDTTPLVMKRDGESGWRKNVERMVVQKGAHIFPGELETLVRYLSTALGPWTVPMQTPGALPPGALGGGAATARDVKLPDGAGKELVQTRCTACHDLGRVVATRRTPPDWDRITRNMVERGPQATPAQVETIVMYLIAHLGKERN